MSEIHLKPVDEHDMDTIIGEDIDFNGELSFEEPLMIKGRVRGIIRAEGDLYIDQHAVVEAEIYAKRLVVKGTVTGEIIASGAVELFSTARVDGNITAADLIMESGCTFNGKSTMTGKAGY
jgi:cytoskeletal protein CcmA (bactofilin family)